MRRSSRRPGSVVSDSKSRRRVPTEKAGRALVPVSFLGSLRFTIRGNEARRGNCWMFLLLNWRVLACRGSRRRDRTDGLKGRSLLLSYDPINITLIVQENRRSCLARTPSGASSPVSKKSFFIALNRSSPRHRGCGRVTLAPGACVSIHNPAATATDVS
jgi:hypothetical protein